MLCVFLSAVGICSGLSLWFLNVQHTMQERLSMVNGARRQLRKSEEKAAHSRGDPEAEAVLARSRSIYRQAVVHYDQAIAHLRYRLPALLMGFPSSGCQCGEKSA